MMFAVPRRRERVDPFLALLFFILIAILAYDHAVFPVRARLTHVPDPVRPDAYHTCLDIHIDYRPNGVRIPGDLPAWALRRRNRPVVVLRTAWGGPYRNLP